MIFNSFGKTDNNFTLDLYKNVNNIKSPIRPFIKWYQHYINHLKKDNSPHPKTLFQTYIFIYINI